MGGARQTALHRQAGARGIGACLPWPRAEIARVDPAVVVLLGATAAQAMPGKDFRVSIHRGKVIDAACAGKTLATLHPSPILRLPRNVDRDRELRRFIDHLQVAASLLNGA